MRRNNKSIEFQSQPKEFSKRITIEPIKIKFESKMNNIMRKLLPRRNKIRKAEAPLEE